MKTQHATHHLQVADMGLQPYRPVWTFQRELQQARIAGDIPDTLLLLEHHPVYTLGKSASANHIIASDQRLQAGGIEVVEVDRGGDVTYHGPGQLVGYPILDLKQHRKSITWYMRQLEEVFIQTLRHWDLTGRREDGYTGVWVGQEKILAMGVRVSRWVTMHGFALNVNPQLEHFNGIIPCGIFHLGVTSIAEKRPEEVRMEEVKKIVLESFQNVFNFSAVESKKVEPHNKSFRFI